jgi:hypothetical protein
MVARRSRVGVLPGRLPEVFDKISVKQKWLFRRTSKQRLGAEVS